MKKSQMLASITAASVLGVAMPAMNAAYALEWGDGSTVKAECSELKNAYTFVEEQAAYQWFVNRAAIDAKTTATPAEYIDYTAGYANALYAALTGNTYTFGTGVTPTPDGSTNPSERDFQNYNNSLNAIKLQATDFQISNADGTTTPIAADSVNGVKKLLAAVENGDATIQAFMALSDAIQTYADAAPAGQAQAAQDLHTAAINFKTVFSSVNSVVSLRDNVDDVATDFTASTIDGIFGNGTVAFFNAINDEYAALKAEQPKVEAGKAAYEGLLNDNILTDSGKTAKAGVTDNTSAPVAGLKAIAADNNANTIYGTAWGTFYTNTRATLDASRLETGATPICTDGESTTTIGGRLKTLASNYKGAAGIDKSLEDVAEEMADYHGGTNTPDDDNQGNNGNQGGNTENDNNNNNGAGAGAGATIDGGKGSASNGAGAPNTGAVSFEGTSAQSASTFSLIATLMAVAGAGLTVLRRNKKNA